MNYFFLGIFSCIALLTSGECNEIPEATSQYLDLYKKYPEALGKNGSAQQGEIEVVLEVQKINNIHEECYQRLLKKGVSPIEARKWSTIGLIAEDQYWIWIRDAVVFPSQVVGTYDRLLWKNSLDGPPGVAVLPILSDKRIVLTLHFRHATRSWELELPRGGRLKNETIESAAKRELQEETGCIVDRQVYIGEIVTDSGVMNSAVPIYCGFVKERKAQDIEFSEAIEDILILSKDQVKGTLLKGHIELSIRGKMVKANCRDAFLTFALFQAENRGLL